MKFSISLSPEAERHLDDLFDVIAKESGPERAQKFVGSILTYYHGFETFPQRGSRRDDIRPGVRIVGFKRRASIAFTVEGHTVSFLGIFYGGQNVEAALGEEKP
jgi:plasmid stabilization system protein ParE